MNSAINNFSSSENKKTIFYIIFSLFFLVFPLFCFLYIHVGLNYSFQSSFLVSFLMHLILLPFLLIVNDKNSWDYDFYNPKYNSWLHPRLIKQVSLALIYPYFFGVYYSFIKYNRLGHTLHLDFSVLGKYTNLIILAIVMLPFLFILFLPFLEKFYNFFNEKRNTLWNNTTGLFYSWYIHKLSKNIVFYFIEKIYKFYKLLQYYCRIENPVYWHSTEKIVWYKHVLNFLYLNALNIFYFFAFGGIILEILIENHIYYGLYILFLIPIVRILGTIWTTIGRSYLNEPACLADYLYTDWKNLKFPGTFAACVSNSDIIYPVILYPTKEQKIKLKAIQQKYCPEYFPYRPKTEAIIHQSQLINRVSGRSWGIRFAAYYWKHEGKRFFHSNSTLKFPGGTNIPPKPPGFPNREFLHPATAAFCRSPMQRVSMYNKDRISYEAIQSVERRLGGTPLHKNTFQSNVRPPKPNETSFVIQTEMADCSYFHYSELKFGINASRYYKHAPVSYVDKVQKQPDVLLDNRSANIEDKRIHPYDRKSGWGVERTNNIIVSNRDKMQFSKLLERHEQFLFDNNQLTSKNKDVLNNIKNNYGNVNGQQDILMPNMQHFSNHFLPPLHSPENFYTGWFSSKANAAYSKAQDTVLFVDDYLVTNNIPKPRTKGEWQDFFNNHYFRIKNDLNNEVLKNPSYDSSWSQSDSYL